MLVVRYKWDISFLAPSKPATTFSGQDGSMQRIAKELEQQLQRYAADMIADMIAGQEKQQEEQEKQRERKEIPEQGSIYS